MWPWRRSRLAAKPVAAPEVSWTLVSAIYDSGPSSLLGGRGRNLDYYLPSLVNIGRLGAPIVVFCPPKDVGTITAALGPHFCDLRVVPWSLDQFEYFEAFIAFKRTYWKDLLINDRNEVLCFMKSYWLQHTAARNYFDHERYFWIDAGLTHHGLFPEELGGVELKVSYPPSHYHPDNPSNIFCPALGVALANAAPRGKVFFYAHPFSRNQWCQAYEQLTAARFGGPGAPVSIDDHLVGGVFGGHRDDLDTVHQLYRQVLEAFIENRIYTLEEQVFSSVHAVHPEWFALQRFETWYYYAAGDGKRRLLREANSFCRMFATLAASGN